MQSRVASRSLLNSVVGAIFLLPTLACADTFRVFTGSYGPQNEVRVSRPAFKWEIWPSQGPARATDVNFQIDGHRVGASYDADDRAVVYNPERPLPNGTHRVDVAVTFEGQYKFNKSWVAVVSSVSLANLPAASATQSDILAGVNAIRSSIGLPGFQMDSRLNMAAAKHAEYLALNNLTGHFESPGTKGFFGQTHTERLAAYGWSGGAWEGVTYGSRTVSEGIRELFDAPYHRLPFLQPGSTAFGSGFAESRMTMEFGNSRQSGTVISPANGQTGVPTRWENAESPNPLRMHTNQKVTGYPVVMARFDSTVRSIRISEATLTLNSSTVPSFLNTPANDDRLQFAAILIPQKPLKAKTEYTATFQGTDSTGRPFAITSTFRTG